MQLLITPFYMRMLLWARLFFVVMALMFFVIGCATQNLYG